MIKIEAIIRPDRVNLVVDAIIEAGCGGFHLVNVTGRGQQQGVNVFTGRGGVTSKRASLPKVLITTVIKDELKDAVVSAIISSARSSEAGEIGDGKIFISPIVEVIRVRTGERNEVAL